MQKHQWRVVGQMALFLLLVYMLGNFLSMILGFFGAVGIWLTLVTGGAIGSVFLFVGITLYLNWQMGADLDDVGLRLGTNPRWPLQLLGGLLLGAAALGFIWVVNRALVLAPMAYSVTDISTLLLHLVLILIGAAAVELVLRGVIARHLLLTLDPSMALGWSVLFETFTVLLVALQSLGQPVGQSLMGLLLASFSFSFFQVALYWRSRSLWWSIGTRTGLHLGTLLMTGWLPEVSFSLGGLPGQTAELLKREPRAATLMALFWLALAALLLFLPGVQSGQRPGPRKGGRYLH